MIPIQIKYGSDKGKLVFLGTFLIIIALCYFAVRIAKKFSFDFGRLKQFFVGLSDWQFLAAGFVLAVVILGIFYVVSVRIMEKKEF